MELLECLKTISQEDGTQGGTRRERLFQLLLVTPVQSSGAARTSAPSTPQCSGREGNIQAEAPCTNGPPTKVLPQMQLDKIGADTTTHLVGHLQGHIPGNLIQIRQ